LIRLGDKEAVVQRYELDADSLYGAFVSGGREVIRHRAAIDRINVFPVADGDTGTNLAMTLGAVIERSLPLATVGATMKAMADAALSGARGNSGMIFAQFLAGLGEAMGDTVSLSSHDFTHAARNAERRAHEAVLTPVSGTILTVIKDWVRGLEEHQGLREFGLIFQNTLKRARESLENTTNLLPVLKRERVVDAGAEGFFRFLSGATRYLTSESAGLAPEADVELAELPREEHGGERPAHRYCTEVLIKGRGIDLGLLRSELPSFGDCGIAAGGPERARVHVHTDDPAAVIRRLSDFGTVQEQKVDDMLREYEVVHERKYPIALVTDSVCDLPRELVDRYQIHVVPLSIVSGGAQYLDGLTVSNEGVYSMMEGREGYPTTSQPSPAALRLLYSFLSSHYDSVIAIHVSGALSGTCAQSEREASRFPEKRITVIDSKQDSGAQGLLVLRAAELIAEGRSHDEVVASVKEGIARTRIFVAVPSLKYMVRGGRVSPLKGLLAALLNLRPIVSLDGAGASKLYGKAFSMEASLRAVERLSRDFLGDGKLRAYGVVHGGAKEEAERFAARLEAAFGRKPLFIQEISPIIALNAGRGALAAVVMKE
jgi:DegV family protein with EDD domain